MKTPWTQARRGSALAMVMVFLAVVAIIAIATSTQSSFVRRASVRSHYGFEAIEVCESAINEAHAQVVFRDVFPSPPFGNLKSWAVAIATNDVAALSASAYPGYTYHFRNFLDANEVETGAKLFVALSWPEDKRPHKNNNYQGFLKQYDVPGSLANGQSLPAFKSLSKVKMSVLSWRRDFVGIAWQDWGVLHYEVACTFDDGKSSVTRRMFVDRMFTIYAHTIGLGNDDPPNENGANPADIFLHFIKSRSNLKCVIQRS